MVLIDIHVVDHVYDCRKMFGEQDAERIYKIDPKLALQKLFYSL